MRIATWNVNSLKARLEAVEQWLERAAPDVLLMQETKLADDDVPEMPFRMAGYELLHHGEGRWNGVAIASKVGIDEPVISNFGDGPVRESRSTRDAPSADDFDPLTEARMVSAVCGGHPRGQPLRAQRPRARLALVRGQAALVRTARALARRGRRPRPMRCCSAATSTSRPPMTTSGTQPAAHGSTHVSEPERAALARLRDWGLVDTYRLHPAGQRPLQLVRLPRRACSTRTWACASTCSTATRPVADRVVWAEIDREARKGPPTPSDHAPVLIDLDEPGTAHRRRLGGGAGPGQQAHQTPLDASLMLPDPPTGMVARHLTDIGGSTRLPAKP